MFGIYVRFFERVYEKLKIPAATHLRIFENIGKCWNIFDNIGEYWNIPSETLREFSRILKSVEQC